MGSYDFESNQEGDWEERGDISWNEFDWQQFLLRQQKEVARFVALYDQFYGQPDHLDRVAQEMGWERDDWSVGDSLEDEPLEGVASPVDEDSFSDSDPYTLHRHPVFVVSTGLFLQIRYLWEAAFAQFGTLLDGHQSWKAANALALAERQLILMIQAVDMGDFLLSVCHGKLALRAINTSLSLLAPLDEHSAESARFSEAVRYRLFDAREVCLRVMNDCREEDRRGFRDGD